MVGVDQAVTSRQSISGDSPQFRTLLNYAQPINRLPPEILSAIFRLVVGPVRATRLRDVLRLSSICHNWRVIILGDGVMWSGICVIGQDPMFIAQQLARCRGAPLYLFLSVPDAVFPVEQVSPLSRFSQAAQMIQTRRSQVRSISAKVGSCRAFKRVFGFDWPNLEGLTWIDACPPESRMHEQNPPLPEEHHRTPKLRYLSAKRGLPWEITGTTSLTTLKLEGPMDIDILKFLQVNPHLESLELTKLRVQPPPANVTSIELPNTIKVVMHDVEYAQLFACVTFPSLRYLTVDPIDRRQQPVEIALSQLQVLPTVTKLKIEYLPHMQHERISIAGLDRTNTTLFNLTERTRFGGGTPAIQALCRTSLPSVTSLSIGGGIPGFWFSLPSTAICTLISGLPRLQRLDLFPHRLSLTIMQHLRSYQHVCPELKILSIALVRSTCEEMFRLLSGFVSDRARSGQWVHRVDCVILKVPGEVYQHAKRTWESLSRGCRFEEYLRCGCSGEVRQAEIQPCFQ